MRLFSKQVTGDQDVSLNSVTSHDIRTPLRSAFRHSVFASTFSLFRTNLLFILLITYVYISPYFVIHHVHISPQQYIRLVLYAPRVPRAYITKSFTERYGMLKPDLLILDADDTLWESARFFERAEEDFLCLVDSLGLDPLRIRTEIHRRDLERLSSTGYGAKPYIDTLQTILDDLPEGASDTARQSFRDIANILINHPVLLMSGVMETLLEIDALGIESVVYTVGEYDHQSSKFNRSGIQKLVNALHVVDSKTPEALQGLLTRYSATPERTVLVGNSPRSDINPALTLGVNAIHLLRDRTWAAEREDYAFPDRVNTIDRFEEIIPVMRRLGILSDPPSFLRADREREADPK